jgi:bacterioferritin-associated ferredoxin
MTIEVGVKGRDYLNIQYDVVGGKFENVSLRAVGCHQLLQKVQALRARLTGEVENLAIPEGHDHASLLVREMVMKIKGVWNFPYEAEELCHCRAVATRKVDEAIVAGDHRVEDVAESTSAGSACGSCRPDTQRIINFRLNKKTA